MVGLAMFRLGVFLGLFFCLSAGAAQARKPVARKQIVFKFNEVKECPGGTENIVTLPWSSEAFRKQFKLQVFGPVTKISGYKVVNGKKVPVYEVVPRTLSKFKEDLIKTGRTPVVVFNGGYFNHATKVPLSYYQTALGKRKHSKNSAMSPRGCFVYEPTSLKHDVIQSTDNQFALFQERKEAEIFCGGPQLIKTGKDIEDKTVTVDISARQYCSERFDPNCRIDGSDPGLKFNESVARTGACVLANGDMKVFVYLSESSDCGVPVPVLAQRMLKEGCVEGLNLDGGGSSKLYAKLPDKEVTRIGVEETLISKTPADRALPVWIAVYEKTKRGK